MFLSLAAAALVSATSSSAATVSFAEVSLLWDAPASCPRASEVEYEVEHLAGRTVTFGVPAKLAVHALVREGWIAVVDVTSVRGTHRRELSAKTCGELARALALVLSLSIEDSTASENAPAPLVAEPRFVVSSVVPESEPIEARTSPIFRGAALGAGAFIDFGTFPSPSLGFVAEARWRPIELLSFGAGGAFLIPQRTVIRETPQAGGAMSAYAARVAACVHAPFQLPLDLAACAGAELAWLRASGFGVTTTRRDTTRWIAPLAALTAALSLDDRVALTATIEARAPSIRPVFVIDGLAEIHRTPALLARVGVAAEIRFP